MAQCRGSNLNRIRIIQQQGRCRCVTDGVRVQPSPNEGLTGLPKGESYRLRRQGLAVMGKP